MYVAYRSPLPASIAFRTASASPVLAALSPAGRAASMTWKPVPLAGPPSACTETTASACTALPNRPRASTHGPTPRSLDRVSRTSTPRAASRDRSRAATSQVKACSAYPVAVWAPISLHGLRIPCPASTSRVTWSRWPMLPPLWPGSITTTGRRTGGALVGGAAGDPVGAAVGETVGRGAGRVLVGATVAACGAAEPAELGAGAATGEDGVPPR